MSIGFGWSAGRDMDVLSDKSTKLLDSTGQLSQTGNVSNVVFSAPGDNSLLFLAIGFAAWVVWGK